MIAKFDLTLAELEQRLQSTKTVNIALEFEVGIQKFRKILKQAGFLYEAKKWIYKGEFDRHTTTINDFLQKEKIRGNRINESKKTYPINSLHGLTEEEMAFLGQAFPIDNHQSVGIEVNESEQVQVTNEQSKTVTIPNSVFEHLHMFCMQHNINMEDFIDLAIAEALEKYEIL